MARAHTWSRLARAEVARGGGVVRRPVGERSFGLHYVRTGPVAAGAPPIVAVPGGPGLASVLPYRAARRRAAERGLDLLMMEHRGIGLSRRDEHGADLPVEQVTVQAAADDLAAVLDDAGIERAVLLGSSYGSYLVQVFGVRHPDRVAGMVLDSPVLSVVEDLQVIREHLRGLFWDGTEPSTVRCAALLRRLVADGTVAAEETGRVVSVVYEFCGPAVLERLLEALARGRGLRTWRRLAEVGSKEVGGPGRPMLLEPDLVRGIAFGQLGFGLPPDGHPLDPQTTYVEAARDAPAYTGEPYDLPSEIGGFRWPSAVISGERDLRTPPPVAERVAALIPDAALVPLAGTGHSAWDTHLLAALNVAHVVAAGRARDLPALAQRIAGLPRHGASRLLGPVIGAGLTLDLLLPG